MLRLLPLLMISCMMDNVVAPCVGEPGPVITCQRGQHICNAAAYLAREFFRYPDDIIPPVNDIAPACSATFIDYASSSGNLCCNPSQSCEPCTIGAQLGCTKLQCVAGKPILRGDPCVGVTGYYRQSLCRRHGRPVDIPNLHRPMFLPPFWANDPSYHERYPLYPGIYKLSFSC